MRKKQLLATLVMLSLMQGSAYAAEDITHKNFNDYVYNATDESIGSVSITSSKGDYILNPVQEGSTIVIDPTRTDGAAIYINSQNATTDLSSLTIKGGVQIAGTAESPLKTTDTLIKVGDSAKYYYHGGKLTIESDLLIDNVVAEKSSSASIISVIGGVLNKNTGNYIASSFSGKDITISNSQAVSKSSDDNASTLIRITGYGDKNASFTANDVNLINNMAYRAIYMDTADTTLKNVSFEDGLYNYGLDTYDETSNVNFKADSISAVGTGFKTAFIRMYSDDSFEVEGDISYDGTGANISVGDLSVAGDNHFINFTNTDAVTVGGDVTVKNLSWNDNVLYVSKADTATFGNITIDNITQNQTSDSNGVQVMDVKEKFTAGDIKVTNMEFLKGNNSQYGVFFWDNESADVKSIEVANLTFQGLDSTYSTSDGNGGVSISSTDFDNTLDSVVIKNIVQKSGENKQKYYGLDFSNSSLAAEYFEIDNVKTNATEGAAIGLSSNGTIQYNSMNISNITGGKASLSSVFGNAGLYLTTGAKLTNLDTEGSDAIIDINTVTGSGKTYGVYNGSGSNGDFSGDVLKVQNITSTEAESYGVYLHGKTDFDDIYVANVKGSENAYGVDVDDIKLNNETVIVNGVEGKTAIGILTATWQYGASSVSKFASVSGINGSDTAVAIAVEAGTADYDAVNISDVKSENGRIALVSAKDGADVSIGSGLITHEDFEEAYTPSYTGNYEGNADSDKNFINSIALRSVGGSTITLGSAASTFADGDNTTADGVFTVVGDIVAGRGDDKADAGSIEINGNNGTRIYGDVFAGNGGEINITLNGEDSILEGQVDDYHEITSENHQIFHNSAFTDDEGNELEVSSAGKATLNINDGGKWIARGQSFVDTVSFNKGVIDMSENENSSVTIKNLNGSGGKFVMNLNTAERDKSDMLYVTGSIEDGGNYEIEIVGDNFDINDITENNPLRFATVKGDVNTDNMKARTTDAGFFNNEYTVTQEDYMDGDAENLIYNGDGNGQGSYKPGNTGVELAFDEGDTNLLIGAVSKQTVSDAGQTIINMSRANYSNAIYMDRLNKRMGEARYINPEDEQGMWVRLRHDRIGKEDAFRSQNTMYEMGYDVKQDCDNGDRRVGFAIDYMDGKTEYRNVAGDGDIKRYGLWLYDTWMGDKGHYADYVLKWGHLENDFDIYNSRGKVNGDYSNNVFSVSAEYGKKNDMGNDWYFEPQAQLQLARVTGADYTTSQGTRVSLDGINSLIGRAGFRLGRDVDERSTVYVKADLLHEFLGDQDMYIRDNTFNGSQSFENKGTWYDVGFGFATALGKDSYAFMDFEKSFGNDNDETYQINAGVQWTF